MQQDLESLQKEKEAVSEWKAHALATLVSISAADGAVSDTAIFEKLKEKIDADIAELQRKIDSEKETVAQLTGELQNSGTKLSETTTALEGLQTTHQTLNESSAQLEKQLQAKTEEAASLAQEVESKKTSIEQLQADVAALRSTLQAETAQLTQTL